MIKYFSSKLGIAATILNVDHKSEVVVYQTEDGKQHVERYEDFIKVFNGIITSLPPYAFN